MGNIYLILIFILTITSFVIVLDILIYDSSVYAGRSIVNASKPILNDPNLTVDLVFSGLKKPTSMTFLGPDDVLVAQKNEGTIERIVNGVKNTEPLITVPVASKDERGLLGSAISKDPISKKTHLFLFYTEKDPTNDQILGNRIYSYELDENGSKLTGSKLLLDLPWEPGPGHNGGVLKIGPDNNLYITIGDMISSSDNQSQLHETLAQNFQVGKEPDGRAGILRITQNGEPVGNGILGSNHPLNLYYAYGIKNSFGIDFDPVTGMLWDTENGPDFGDEINLVESGFNSGWKKTQGIWYVDAAMGKSEVAPMNPSELVNFNSKGKYSPPEFTWDRSVAPTALEFLDTNKLGPEYENAILVADIKSGSIYIFNVTENRKSLDLNEPLDDKVANKKGELSKVIFGYGFGGITDLKVGPDGYLYVLAYDKEDGRIYRVH
ncbi:MAG TPA: PQQ-dependent sugar dehydrogenase [Nitrososphaeraceae archaeon]|nr:PQQ-dependent sugar dehydrogenase [Nitrososphaeraceae archaeon]